MLPYRLRATINEARRKRTLDDYLSEDLPFYPRAQEAFQYEGQQLALPETFSRRRRR